MMLSWTSTWTICSDSPLHTPEGNLFFRLPIIQKCNSLGLLWDIHRSTGPYTLPLGVSAHVFFEKDIFTKTLTTLIKFEFINAVCQILYQTFYAFEIKGKLLIDQISELNLTAFAINEALNLWSFQTYNTYKTTLN